MPIEIRESPEPRSDAARTASELLLVSTDASEILQHELRRYCKREINGRSFLIAGHRGAGKTTLVESAWLSIWKESEEGKTPLRPLFVLLHGPSLFTSAIQPGPVAGQLQSGASSGATADKGKADKPNEGQSAAGTGTPSMPSTKDGEEKTPKSTSELQTVLEQIILALHRAVAHEYTRDLWQRRAPPQLAAPIVATNAWTWLRDKIEAVFIGETPQDPAPLRYELAAQFEAELYESPDAQRLRDLFARLGAIPDGVLRRRNGNSLGDRNDGTQAWRELVALSAICDAYRLLSSKVDESLKETNKDEEEAKREIALDSAKANLLTPLYSLLAGGLVGVGTGAATNTWFAGAMSGLITALGSALVLKASHTRSRTQTSVRQVSIVIDRRPATLDRVLPIFVSRLLDAGLAPMFVVDELDKVQGLDTKMKDMVHHLKKLVAESAFFCFLADREYFETMARKRRETAYAVEYTYFTHDLFVVFSPRGFHKYLADVLIAPGSSGAMRTQDDVDCEVLPYVLLHRARMHAIDVRRFLTRWRTDKGYVDFTPGEVVTEIKYRLDVLLQLAIEGSLESDKFRERLANDPELLRMAYDAMYYITRRWVHTYDEQQEDGGRLLLDDSDEAKRRFVEYLTGRMRTEDQPSTTPTPAVVKDEVAPKGKAATKKGASRAANTGATSANQTLVPPPETVRFLYERVQEFAALLADPKLLAAEITKWNKYRKKVVGGAARLVVAKTVLNAAGLDYGEIPTAATPGASVPQPDDAPVVVLNEGLVLLEAESNGASLARRYKWRYQPEGTELFKRPAAKTTAKRRVGAPPAWRKDAAYIRSIEKMLDGLTLASVKP